MRVTSNAQGTEVFSGCTNGHADVRLQALHSVGSYMKSFSSVQPVQKKTFLKKRTDVCK